MNEELLKKIMEETRKIFITETKNKVNKTYLMLINYCILNKESDRFLLENFFHSVKGSAAISGFDELTNFAKDYEKFMIDKKDKVELSDDDRVHIFTGISAILAMLIELEKQFLHRGNDSSTESNHINIEEKSSEGGIEWSYDKKNITLEHTGGNILIVDDDVVMLDYLERSLSAFGYKAYVTTSPEEVKMIVMSKRIDLILIDVLIPEKSGFEIFENIKKCNFDGGVIFLTSKNEIDNRLKGIRAGADDYITKPFVIEELLARIERIIKAKYGLIDKINRDDLTNAHTRSFFYEKFRDAMNDLENSNKEFSLVLADIDSFKNINRNNGFFVGDMILKKFVDELKTHFKEEMIFRLESDKFLILLEKTDAKIAYNILEKILRILSTKNYAPLKEPITFSSTIYTVSSVNDNLENILSTIYDFLKNSKQKEQKKIEIMEYKPSVKSKIRVLIVDDESVMVYLIKKRLEDNGYEIFYSNDGYDAMEKVKRIKPNIVILDLMIPRINGFEVIKLIRNDIDLKEIRIIIISAKDDEQDIIKCYDMGANDYLKKPFDFEELEKRIIRLLKT